MIESGFIRAIHRILPREVYRWKISDSYTAGIADAYYSGDKGDLWIEYKYFQTIPKTVKEIVTALQADWLNNRYEEGRNVSVVVGYKRELVHLWDKDWNKTFTREDFQQLLTPRKNLIDWVVSQCIVAT